MPMLVFSNFWFFLPLENRWKRLPFSLFKDKDLKMKILRLGLYCVTVDGGWLQTKKKNLSMMGDEKENKNKIEPVAEAVIDLDWIHGVMCVHSYHHIVIVYFRNAESCLTRFIERFVNISPNKHIHTGPT